MGLDHRRLLGMDPQLHSSPTTIRAHLTLVAGEEDTELMHGELRYDTDDPFAVTLEVDTDAGPVTWTFARELLAEGRYDPCGDGDVQVWPCLSVTATAVTVIELHSPEGDGLLQAPTREIDRFLAETFVAVPAGQESRHFPVDSLVAQLLGWRAV